MKKAFTLAEIMVVLVVIGILAAILLPMAFQAAPNEEVLKFKKANSTLGTAIKQLINSDEYYSDGDLGVKAGVDPSGNHVELKTEVAANHLYFCLSLVDFLSTKSSNCVSSAAGDAEGYVIATATGAAGGDPALGTAKGAIDTMCTNAGAQATLGSVARFVTADNITWFEPNSQIPFGSLPSIKDKYGFEAVYKVICVDVDVTYSGANITDVGATPPFGYGIRRDGKILPGARADEYILKSAQNKD